MHEHADVFAITCSHVVRHKKQIQLDLRWRGPHMVNYLWMNECNCCCSTGMAAVRKSQQGVHSSQQILSAPPKLTQNSLLWSWGWEHDERVVISAAMSCTQVRLETSPLNSNSQISSAWAQVAELQTHLRFRSLLFCTLWWTLLPVLLLPNPSHVYCRHALQYTRLLECLHFNISWSLSKHTRIVSLILIEFRPFTSRFHFKSPLPPNSRATEGSTSTGPEAHRKDEHHSCGCARLSLFTYRRPDIATRDYFFAAGLTELSSTLSMTSYNVSYDLVKGLQSMTCQAAQLSKSIP